jgi:hypothetical protein
VDQLPEMQMLRTPAAVTNTFARIYRRLRR